MACSICNGSVGLIAAGRCKDGKICKHCWDNIPKAFLLPEEDVSQLTKESISELIKYKDKEAELKDRYIESSEYGSIHIDAHHGVLCICNPGEKEDVEGTYFDMLNLKEISMSMDVKESSREQVLVSVKASLTFHDLSAELINVPVCDDFCFVETITGNNITFSLPYKAKIMLSEIIRINRELIDAKIFQMKVDVSEEAELQRAKGLFMIRRDYTESEIKKTRNKLIKAFHPDEGEDLDEKAKEITKAYDLLKKNLRGN